MPNEPSLEEPLSPPETPHQETRPSRWGGRVSWWGAALGATAVAGGGAFLGGVWFPTGVAVGCVLAALLVRRNGFFTVIAQPPLVAAGVVAGAVVAGKPSLNAVAELSATFPYLVATMAVVGLIVLGRRRVA